MEQSVGDNVRSARAGSRAPLMAYAAAQLALLAVAVVVPFPVGGISNMLAMLVGLVVATGRLARIRPTPPWAWWLVVSTGWTLVAGGIVASVAYGIKGGATIADAPSIVLAAIPLFMLGAGLGLFSRVGPRRGPADILDALMVALAAFLVLWAVWLGPAFEVDVVPAIIATILPLGLLVIVTMGLKVLLGGGAKDPPVALVLVGAAALAGATIAVLAPGVGQANLPASLIANLLWATFGIAVGAATLHPAIVRPRIRQAQPVGDASAARTVLFALLALVPLGIWVSQTADRRGTGRAVPIAISAVLLVLLVARMGLVSRLAHHRAAQLDRRSSALARAVSREQDLQRQLAFRATHDPLTNLSNRIELSERMAEAMAGPGPHSLLLLDLDRFKDINDTHGHPVGDQLLIAVAQRLRRGTPGGAVLARLGGDEFAVFLPRTDQSRAQTAAVALLNQLRAPYPLGANEFVVTSSIGVLTTDRSDLSPTQALSDADLALYRSKQLGRDRVECFRPELRVDHLDRARVLADLRRAVQEEQFALRYQPIVDLGAGTVVAVEALLRWHRPDGTVLAPADFLAIAEESGLIGPLGEWVLRRACRDVHRWYTDQGISVFVNVAARQLDHPEFATSVIKAIADSGLAADAVVLDVTEESLIAGSPVDLRRRQLRILREHNIRLAIDDFGTGYASLSALATLPVDFVKIDPSLIRAITGDSRDRAFTHAVIDFVHNLHLTAIAEGVETAEQAQALRDTTCPLAQGFHFGRPAGPSQIDTAIRPD